MPRAATFGETVTAIELAPEGTGYTNQNEIFTFLQCSGTYEHV